MDSNSFILNELLSSNFELSFPICVRLFWTRVFFCLFFIADFAQQCSKNPGTRFPFQSYIIRESLGFGKKNLKEN